MPNLKQQFNQFMDRILGRPEYYRFMQENATGYRGRAEAQREFQLVRNDPSALFYNEDAHLGEAALKVYGRAGRPHLEFLILGSNNDKFYGSRVSTEQFPFIDRKMLYNLGRLNESRVPFGSVLSSVQWSFYMNDLLIYGGIANRQQFYLASRRVTEALWEPLATHPSIFARELAGLFSADYELRRLPDGSEVMVPPKKTISFSLSQYMEILPHFMTREVVDIMTRPDLRGMLYVRGTNTIVPYNKPLYTV